MQLLLPPRAALRLVRPRFRIAADAHAVEVLLRDLARQTGGAVGGQGLTYDGDDVVLEGHDAPSLLWSLGPGARVATTWTLLANIATTTPAWLGEVLALEAVGEGGRALLASTAVEDSRAQPRYRACRRAALAAGEVRVQAGDGTEILAALTPRADDGVAFTVTVPRARASRLRLTLPPVAGTDLELTGPFPLRARLQPSAGTRVAGEVVQTTAAGTVLEFALEEGDPPALSLTGVLR
jgi:hypothetical protein